MHAFSEGRCPQHTALSIWAMATCFVRSPYIQSRFPAERLQMLGDSDVLGRTCALRSSEEVLPNIISPTLDIARTCLLLGMYWFAKGDCVRNTMFQGIANRAARTIVQESKWSKPGRSWLHCEIERRVLWSSWVTHCVNSDLYVIGSSADACMLNLPLPASPAAFEKVEVEPKSCLSDTLELADVARQRPAPWDTNISAEVDRLVLHWARIHDHIEQRKRVSAKQSLIELLDLDHWLSNWMRTMAPDLVYNKSNLCKHTSEGNQMTFVLLHSGFHQCRMILHATVVPQFGGLSASNEISPETVRISAVTALNNANAIAGLAADLLELDIDPSRLPPIVGHSMYVAATIHITFISASHTDLSNSARKGLTSTLAVLKLMKPYWANLQKLVRIGRRTMSIPC